MSRALYSHPQAHLASPISLLLTLTGTPGLSHLSPAHTCRHTWTFSSLSCSHLQAHLDTPISLLLTPAGTPSLSHLTPAHTCRHTQPLPSRSCTAFLAFSRCSEGPPGRSGVSTDPLFPKIHRTAVLPQHPHPWSSVFSRPFLPSIFSPQDEYLNHCGKFSPKCRHVLIEKAFTLKVNLLETVFKVSNLSTQVPQVFLIILIHACSHFLLLL